MKKGIRFWILFLLVLHLFAGNTEKPYLLLISIDGCRYDYLDRGKTPTINKLAEEGVRAWSLQPSFPTKTFPNHYTIVTGLYPVHHRLIFNFMKNPYTGELFKLSKREVVTNPKWYGGEPIWVTAERHGIKTASFFWPGTEVTAAFRRPSIFKKYDKTIPYTARVDSILAWMQLPDNQKPHFLTLYFEFVDTYGHRFGPNSKEVNQALRNVDQAIARLVKGLKKLNLFDKINIMIVSDHGMQELLPAEKGAIYLSQILPLDSVEVLHYGAVGMIRPKNEKNTEIYYQMLKKHARHFRVYKKEEIPDYLHFKNHPFIAPIVIVPDAGYQIESRPGRRKGYYGKGDHGYDSSLLSMHGIFVAHGPAFKSGFVTGTLKNIDLYPLMCKVLNIYPAAPVDGKLENIEYILKEY